MDDHEVRENVRPLGNVERIEKEEEDSSRRVQVAEPVWGAQVGEVDLKIHPAGDCEGNPCPFHHPSEHHMVEWPKNVRLDKSALVERTCEHGVGHPDPDSIAYFERTRGEQFAWTLGVHGCDGCCQP